MVGNNLFVLSDPFLSYSEKVQATIYFVKHRSQVTENYDNYTKKWEI
jgi:hypothetical protein